jgi:phage portal protein BeeE
MCRVPRLPSAMAWKPRSTRVREAQASTAAAVTQSAPHVMTAGLVPTWTEWSGMQALWAMQVPAFNRGVRLISGTVAQLPLVEWDNGVRVQNLFLAQPEADKPPWVTMQRLTRDLVLHGKAYWLIQATMGGYPTVVKGLPAGDVSEDEKRRTVRHDTQDYPLSDPSTPGAIVGTVIRFDGFADGALIAGVDVITTALSLEAAARNYADVPAPTQVLRNVSNYEMSDTEIDQALAEYTRARKESSVAYVNGGFDLSTFGYSAQDLQLTEARNQAAIQIARLLNLDPFWVGAGVPGSALTYQNRVDMRQDLVDLTLSDYLVPIEQRLSMQDVTPTVATKLVRHDTGEFLRSNLDTRVNMAVALLGAEAISVDEARAFLDDKPTNRGPFA